MSGCKVHTNFFAKQVIALLSYNFNTDISSKFYTK